MNWDHIAMGWKQLIAKVAFSRSPKPETDAKPDISVRAGSAGGRNHDTEPSTPYTGDSRRDRGDFSLHLSC